MKATRDEVPLADGGVLIVEINPPRASLQGDVGVAFFVESAGGGERRLPTHEEWTRYRPRVLEALDARLFPIHSAFAGDLGLVAPAGTPFAVLDPQENQPG